jgi:hypothetical protein
MKRKCIDMFDEILKLKRQNMDLTVYTQWEPLAHEQFTQKLTENGMTEQDIDKESLYEAR